MKPAALADLDLDDFETVMGLNLRVTVQCAQALLPGMRAAGSGHIIGRRDEGFTFRMVKPAELQRATEL